MATKENQQDVEVLENADSNIDSIITKFMQGNLSSSQQKAEPLLLKGAWYIKKAIQALQKNGEKEIKQ